MLAMEAAYQVGEKPVTGAIVESVLSKQIDELEPTLTRHGYDARGLAELIVAANVVSDSRLLWS
jgi:hypothetical protein